MSAGSTTDDGRIYEEIGSLKQQLQTVKQDMLASRNNADRGWASKWGAYLGIIAAIFAVPTGLKQVINDWYQHANLSIQSQPTLTISRDLNRNVLVFRFLVHASNHGNKYGQVLAGSAHLRLASQPSATFDAAQDHVRLADEGAPAGDASFVVVPTETPKSINTAVDFGQSMTLSPGSYRFEVTLKDENDHPLPKVDAHGKPMAVPLRFCFPVDASQIRDLPKLPIVLAYSEEAYSGCQVLLGDKV